MTPRMTVVFVAAMLVACGGSGKDVGASKPTSSASGGTRDACELITTADLRAEFAARRFLVDTAGPVSRNRVGKGNQASNTSCTFSSTESTPSALMAITVSVLTSASDALQPTIDQMKRGATSLGTGAVPVDVAGLGDGAYWVNLGNARRSAVAVNVRQGARRWLTVSESSSGQTEAETVEHLTKLAKVALARL